MKECKCEVKDYYNPLNLKGGDVVEQINGSSKGALYLVVKIKDKLYLNDLEDGKVWSSDTIMGYSNTQFKKVNVCFKRDC